MRNTFDAGIIVILFALAGFFLMGCTSAQVTQAQTDITVGCDVAPLMAMNAADDVKAQVAAQCAAAEAVMPIVAPALIAPAK